MLIQQDYISSFELMVKLTSQHELAIWQPAWPTVEKRRQQGHILRPGVDPIGAVNVASGATNR